jgi:double-strand break repair protein MRE11
MVLLGGDLFHDNKPSRKSMYQVMRSLRKNCLGDRPCELEFLSDPLEVFEGAFSHVNYEDPNINVSIPVFSIHGNHDDPSGDGHFCSLDLLQVAGLVNYFGRVPEADNISVRPILLQKGTTKLALYGLSNVRDERLFRTFRDRKVKWFSPGTQSEWFGLLTVHQNHHAHTATSYLPENALPDWMDLVVWGHEHECEIDPKKNPETGFHVMQPGSSVATSLVSGEAVQKHVAILNVTGKDFTVDKVPLKSVRPFVTREIVLASHKRFKGLDTKKENRQELTKRLMETVEEMIEEANAEWHALREEDEQDGEEDPPLPLIRLKVEYTPSTEGGQFDCENPQRFSNRFIGKVANTNDVVYFYRKKSGQSRQNRPTAMLPEEGFEDLGGESVKVERLVQEYLAAQSLKILPEAPFGDAVNQFVTKDDKHAMESFVDESLAGQVRQMLELDSDEDDLDNAMETYKAKIEARFQAGNYQAKKRVLLPKPDDWDSDFNGHWDQQPGAWIEETQNPLARHRTQQSANDDDRMMDDDDEVPPPPPARSALSRGRATAKTKAIPPAAKKEPPKKAPVRRGRKPQPPEEDSADDIMLEDEEPAPTQPPAPKRTQPTRTTRTSRQTMLNFTQSQRPPQKPSPKPTQNYFEISDDEISDDDAFEPASNRSRRR